jgi:hypothetical protein
MWCKSDPKITSKLKGSANFDNSWKKTKHLKGIDQSSKGKGYDGKNFKKQVEKFQENTKKNGK